MRTVTDGSCINHAVATISANKPLTKNIRDFARSRIFLSVARVQQNSVASKASGLIGAVRPKRLVPAMSVKNYLNLLQWKLFWPICTQKGEWAPTDQNSISYLFLSDGVNTFEVKTESSMNYYWD